MKPMAWSSVALAVVALASCTGDEKDEPDPTDSTFVPITLAVTTTVASTLGGQVTPTTAVATPKATESTVATTTSTVAAPPVTCGPDPDETHPPPCD